MMKRTYNFAPGPAVLPESVLKQLQKDVYDYADLGIGILELSHRSKEFDVIAEESESRLRHLLGISSEYYVLFLNDGSTKQFSMVPRNLCRDKKSADYIQTGYWSQRAIEDAQKFVHVRLAASTKDVNYVRLPMPDEIDIDHNTSYVHYTANETINGLEFPYVPKCYDLPLVSDMSSNFLSKPIDVNQYGLIYASAQKNFGPSAFCVVIIRKDLVGHAPNGTPKLDDYAVHIKAGSRYNTPNTIAWYTAYLMFDWIKDQGGLEVINEHNHSKSKMLYDYIDKSTMYINPIYKDHRSRMNVPFTLRVPDEDLEKLFVEEAKKAHLNHLEGHRSIGGMRASIYNSMPVEGVKALIDFMKEFEAKHNN